MSVRARHIILKMKDQRVLFVVSKVRTERLHGTENDVSHSKITPVPQQACFFLKGFNTFNNFLFLTKNML